MENNQNYTILGNVKTNCEFFSWYNLLAAGKENRKAEMAILFDQTGSILSTIWKYRSRLMQNNPIQELSIENMEQFRQQLEQMFLEPITIGYSKTIKRVMQMNEWSCKQLTEEHNQNPEKRIWQIICCRNRYIAS